MIPTSTQRYKYECETETLILDITDILRNQKQGLKASHISYIEGTFVVKLRAQNIYRIFLYTITSD